MKRSERFSNKARHSVWMAAVMISVFVAGCVWSARALLEPLQVSGGALLGSSAVALVGLCLAGCHAGDAWRYRRLARTERRWEEERGVHYAAGGQCWE